MSVKIKKILEAGKVVYPATILDAIKDAKSVIVNGDETNKWYGKTLREILADLASGATEEVKTLEDKLYTGTPAQGTEGEEGYVPAVEGDIPAIKARLDVIEGEDEGSIKKAAADAVAEVVADAPEAFDTLKEIAEWIAKDTNADAFDAAQRITNLESAVGTEAVAEELYKEGDELPEGKQVGDVKTEAKEATGLYKAIEEAVADANSAIDDLEVEETTVKNAETDEIVSFKYKEEDGIVTISDLTVTTSTLGEVGLTQGEDGKWVEGTANEAKGLATAADVATELINDEKVIAAALNDHEARINSMETAEAAAVTYSEHNITVDSESAVLNGSAIAAIKDYVDDHFSTEDLSDAEAAAVDYEDVF